MWLLFIFNIIYYFVAAMEEEEEEETTLIIIINKFGYTNYYSHITVVTAALLSFSFRCVIKKERKREIGCNVIGGFRDNLGNFVVKFPFNSPW